MIEKQNQKGPGPEMQRRRHFQSKTDKLRMAANQEDSSFPTGKALTDPSR